MKKLNYINEDICVCLIRGKEPPKSILEASGTIAEPNRRTSKRSRKSAHGNSINLNVSASTSVYQLKMMIWESFGVCNCSFLFYFSLTFSTSLPLSYPITFFICNIPPAVMSSNKKMLH